MADQSFDIIVVGGGSNGLTCAAYLAKAGLSVLVLERRSIVGGGCVSEELTLPGFQHNPHSAMHVWLHLGPVFEDLELERHGSSYVFPEVQYAAVFPEGESLILYRDLDKTVEQVARFSAADAEAYRAFCAGYRGLVDGARTFMYSQPSVPWLGWSAMMNTPDGAELVKTSLTSIRHLVYDLFESPYVRSWVLLFMNQTGADDLPGSGTFVPPLWPIIHYTQGVGCAVGGSSSTAEALAKAVEAHGGTVLRGQHVSRILVEAGRAVGVEVQDGARFRARRAVVSNIEPKQTFLELVGEGLLDGFFIRQVKRYRHDEFTTFCVHAALSEPPDWAAAATNPDVQRAWTVGVIPSTQADEDYKQLWADIRNGVASDTFTIFALTPTILDPTQAPEGKHALLLWQPAVFELVGGAQAWDAIREQYAWKLYDALRLYAANMTRSNVLKLVGESPLDLERRNISMWMGSMLGGERTQDQLTVFRPYYGYPPYRSPIESLYLCGPSTHPEGGLSGACGYNAATAIAEDLGVPRWWGQV